MARTGRRRCLSGQASEREDACAEGGDVYAGDEGAEEADLDRVRKFLRDPRLTSCLLTRTLSEWLRGRAPHVARPVTSLKAPVGAPFAWRWLSSRAGGFRRRAVASRAPPASVLDARLPGVVEMQEIGALPVGRVWTTGSSKSTARASRPTLTLVFAAII